MATKGDFVENALGATETTETEVGTITIPQGVSKIIALYGDITIQTTTAAEGAVGFIRLDSSDLSLAPAKFPARIVQGAAGTLAGIGPDSTPHLIPVDIPVTGSARVVCYAATELAQTGTCRGRIGFIMQ